MITVGVTGVSAADNPGPGIGVARSLKADPGLRTRIVALAYDAMEPGIYLDWLVDKTALLPYVAGSGQAMLDRLLYLKDRCGLDLVIPCLDAELPFFISRAPELARRGIRTFLPSREQFELRSKERLPEVARVLEIEAPWTRRVGSPGELVEAAAELGLPLMVKGPLYGAYAAYNHQDLLAHHDRLVAGYGYPLLLQRIVSGDELNVVGVGDGEGGSLGLVGIKKLSVTALGKIWTGTTIRHPLMLQAAERFLRLYRWRGPFELECIVRDDTVYLIEINPRFPAWSYFATGVGVNLPARLLRRAFDLSCAEAPDYEPGRLFIRYSYEIVTSMDAFQKIITTGES